MFSSDLVCSAYQLHIKKHLQPLFSTKFEEHKVFTMSKTSSCRQRDCKSSECKLSSHRRIKSSPISKSGMPNKDNPMPNGPSVNEASYSKYNPLHNILIFKRLFDYF